MSRTAPDVGHVGPLIVGEKITSATALRCLSADVDEQASRLAATVAAHAVGDVCRGHNFPFTMTPVTLPMPDAETCVPGLKRV
jgi:hypothetical protein